MEQRGTVAQDAARGHSPDIDKWLRLIHADGVGPVTCIRILKRFRSIDKALGASVAELMHVQGIGEKTARRIAVSGKEYDPEPELALADKLNVQLIHLGDGRYPALLRRIYDPPPILYVKGTLRKQDSVAIAIVGSRRHSAYGREQATRFAHWLGAAGLTIVSGMARGIDTWAHHGALAAAGRTIAVQGCGLAKRFPPENAKLFDLIAESGACISELPLSAEPLAEHFPPRNRIIAGLSLGVIVVEAAERSGALITASAALEYNREVMAVAGQIDSPLSKGTNGLIKQGARLVETVEDVMDAIGYYGEQLREHVAASAAAADQRVEPAPSQASLTANEKKVFTCLGKQAQHVEEIIAQSQLPAGSVNASLISLRLKGLIASHPGNMHTRR